MVYRIYYLYTQADKYYVRLSPVSRPIPSRPVPVPHLASRPPGTFAEFVISRTTTTQRICFFDRLFSVLALKMSAICSEEHSERRILLTAATRWPFMPCHLQRKSAPLLYYYIAPLIVHQSFPFCGSDSTLFWRIHPHKGSTLVSI